jgi:hypothetical protein
MRLSETFLFFAAAECIRIDSGVQNEMAIITRQPAAKILIPDACHIVKTAFLCKIVGDGNSHQSI